MIRLILSLSLLTIFANAQEKCCFCSSAGADNTFCLARAKKAGFRLRVPNLGRRKKKEAIIPSTHSDEDHLERSCKVTCGLYGKTMHKVRGIGTKASRTCEEVRVALNSPMCDMNTEDAQTDSDHEAYYSANEEADEHISSRVGNIRMQPERADGRESFYSVESDSGVRPEREDSHESYYSVSSGDIEIINDKISSEAKRSVGLDRCESLPDSDRRHCYYAAEVSDFSLRGPRYETNKEKIPAATALFDLAGVDIFPSKVEVDVDAALSHWITATERKHLIVRVTGRGGFDAIITFRRNGRLDDAFDAQFDAFLADPTCKNLKIIFGNIHSAGSMASNLAVRALRGLLRPIVLKHDKKVSTTYETSPIGMIATLDISRASAVEKVSGYLQYLTLELGFVLEASGEDLPERLIGTVGFEKVGLPKILSIESPIEFK